jgi:hypothetical protein
VLAGVVLEGVGVVELDVVDVEIVDDVVLGAGVVVVVVLPGATSSQAVAVRGSLGPTPSH